MTSRIIFIFIALWLVGQGAPIYELGETTLWPQSDYMYTWFSYFGYNLQCVFIMWLATKFQFPKVLTPNGVTIRFWLHAGLLYFILDTLQMFLFDLNQYNSLISETLCLFLGLGISYFVVLPRLRQHVAEYEEKRQEKENSYIT